MYDVNLSHTTILSFLDDHPPLRFVRLLWLDHVSVLRGRVLTITHFRDLVEKGRYHGLGSLNMFQANNSPPDLYDGGDWGLGQSWLVPDSSSIRLQPGDDTHALIFCYFLDKLALPLSPNPGDRCPRQVLQRAIQCAYAVAKVDFQVGFEIEFTCPPSPDTGYPLTHEVSGIRTLEGFMMPILCEITEKLTQAGIAVLHFHAEATAHQFEIALAPMSPLEAVDSLVIARETIWNVCHSHSVVPSFSPQSPVLNGIHLNLSVLPTCPHGQDDLYNNFLSGVLSHLPAISAFGLSHPLSYDRTAPSSGCVGRHIAWGTENRFVPIRQKSKGLWEFRFLDDYSNFHLVLAAIIHCGGIGVRDHIDLQIKDCQVDPAMLNDEAREKYGITEELPSDLEGSCKALLQDEALVKILAEKMVSSYVSVIKRRASNRTIPR